MEPNFSIQQSIVKHGIAVETLVALAKLSAKEGMGFRLVTQFEHNPEEKPITYLVGPTDSQKLDVNIIFATEQDRISNLRVQVLTLPKYPARAKAILRSTKLECDVLKEEEPFETLIQSMTAKLEELITAAVTSNKAQDILFELESPEYGT